MKKLKFAHVFVSLLLIQILISGCKESVIREIEITYQVTATSLDRPLTIYYANDLNGEDVVNDTTTLLWEKTYVMKSDTTLERLFDLYVYSWEAWPDAVSQVVTTRIIEHGNIVAEKSSGGTAGIGYSDTYIYVYLPSKNRYE
jgi:hypothetical protein